MNEKQKLTIYKILSIGLCAAMILIGILIIFSPIIATNTISISPFDLIISITISDLNAGQIQELIVSYYIYKYFFTVYTLLIVIFIFMLTYNLVTKNKNSNKRINNIMYYIFGLLFIAMFIGLNYMSTYAIRTDGLVMTTSPIYFFIGLFFIIVKIVLDIILGKELLNEELKESSVSIAAAFVLLFLSCIALFFPLYIFPGTIYRLSGIDMIFGVENILDFLPMTSTYKLILIIYPIIVILSFIVNLFLYLKKTKAFLYYNRFNNIFGILSLIIYALMGLNYILIYVDTKAYSTFFNNSINTYSYMPLLLFILFWLGMKLVNIATSKLNIEYKVYSQPNETARNTGATSNINNGLDDINTDPIPAFSELDRKVEKFNEENEKRLENSFTDLTLPKLVKHIIEYARFSDDRLSYGPVEIKTFIAGLASSRLAILQGMSGTGKTSLPKIFMEAIDGICDLVAVESSWRDKNELLGFYSEFKRKYTPKSFTQFLYKATLNKDVPYFIVLDEMNLSRIEYYFSDFLSIMEARENDRNIKLFDIQLYPLSNNGGEYIGLRDGHTIDIPSNVWFIGTANRDESTFEISDKVYDRAQTMNFDKRATKVYITEQVDYPKRFVSYEKLRQLFDETKAVGFDAENYEVIKKVENLLKPYNISFGNRILKQIETFVNAYVSCSDTDTNGDRGRYIHEAVDCIIFSKVVRKLELKQIMDIDLLIEEFENLGLTKCVEFLHTLVEAI